MAKVLAGGPPPVPTTTKDEASAAPAIPVARGGAGFADVEVDIDPQAARPFVLIWSRQWHSTPDGPMPILFPQRVEGGIAGVRAFKDGSYDLAGLVEDARKAGKVVLDWALGYCVQVRPGLDAWRPVWARVVDGALVEDPVAYVGWVKGLLERGVLPHPTDRDLERVEERESSLVVGDLTDRDKRSMRSLAANLELTRAARAVLGGA